MTVRTSHLAGLFVVVVSLAVTTSTSAKAPKPGKAKKAASTAAPIVSQPAGTILLDEPLATTADKGWRTAKGKWEFVDGAWRAAELKSDKHGAVARHDVGFTDVEIEFDFKLDGARAISLSINDPAGHNSRLGITPTSVRITKDDHDHAGPDKAAQLDSSPAKFEGGKWYHARIKQVGPSFEAHVGDLMLSGKHDAVAVGKSNIGLTVAGETASFKNLTVKVPAAK